MAATGAAAGGKPRHLTWKEKPPAPRGRLFRGRNGDRPISCPGPINPPRVAAGGPAMGPRLQKRSNLPRHAWAMGLAACAHLLAFLLLGWRIPKLAVPDEDRSPALEVTLVRPQILPRERSTAAPTGPAPSAPRPSSRVLTTPTPGAPALSAPAQSPPIQSPPASTEAAPDNRQLQGALQGLVGCSDPKAFGLTREQREACDHRLASATPAPVGRSYSTEELAQFEAGRKYDPILVRKPHNGCLPRLADRATPSLGPPPPTRSGATTAFGIGCAWSF